MGPIDSQADGQPDHIGLVSSANQAKNNNSRRQTFEKLRISHKCHVNHLGLKGCLGYLRQLHCVTPFIHHPQGWFALSLHLLNGKLELPFMHLVTEHILLTSSLNLCYFLGQVH